MNVADFIALAFLLTFGIFFINFGIFYLGFLWFRRLEEDSYNA